jgi:hypothetical protein
METEYEDVNNDDDDNGKPIVDDDVNSHQEKMNNRQQPNNINHEDIKEPELEADGDDDVEHDDRTTPNRGWGRGIVQDFRSTVMVRLFEVLFER